MKKFVTILIVVLPLILLVALLAITRVASVSTKIHVSGIVIDNKGDDGVFVLDMSDYHRPLFEQDLGVTILPYTASNKNYTLSIVDPTTNEPTDIVEKDDDGAFRLNAVGNAKLVYESVDGGYRDSVIFSVISSKSLNVTPTLKDGAGAQLKLSRGEDADYAANISVGEYVLDLVNYPASATEFFSVFESSNADALFIDAHTGRLTARFAGNYLVSVLTTTQDGTEISNTIRFNVSPLDAITINGRTDSLVSAPTGANEITLYVGANGVSASSFGCDSEYVDEVLATKLQTNAYKVTVRFKDAHPTDAISLDLKVGDETVSLTVQFADFEFEIFSNFNKDDQADLVALSCETTTFSAICKPYAKNIRYEWSVGSQKIAQIANVKDDVCVLRANEYGETTLTLTARVLDEDGNVTHEYVVKKTLVSTPKYTSLLFSENSATHGLADCLAIASGEYDEDGNFASAKYTALFKAYNNATLMPSFEDIVFTSSDTSLATVEYTAQGIQIAIHGTGKATITATFKYADKFLVPSATFTFDAVDGVYVKTYDDIMRASDESRKIVLANDVSLGEQLFNVFEDGTRTQKYGDARMLEILQSETKTLKTTADWTYYKNLEQEQPSVRYCLEFTNDVYGNGFTIDADNIVNMLDATENLFDFAVFTGPLDFVATSDNGIKLAAVKAQDNIVFLVRRDGITIENVTLKGMRDESLHSDGQLDLTLLNKSGTTLEIMSDATVSHSRVMNGRTVLRAFGRSGIDENSQINVQNEKINVRLCDSVLQNAREFILKIGTNRAIVGNLKNVAPALVDQSGNKYACNKFECDDYIDDSYFVDNFVLTDVVVKDCTFKTSGLFSIGIESRFSGPFLVGGPLNIFQLEGWDGLSATSYPAMLHVVGNVVLDDWKELASVDSSTLIETDGADAEDTAFLNLNIKEMLLAVQKFGGAQYDDIILHKDGKDFVHGGIALYGGGKNYSVVDMAGYTGKQLSGYTVNLSILKNSSDPYIKQQGELLPMAAGAEDFRFFMLDAKSGFND